MGGIEVIADDAVGIGAGKVAVTGVDQSVPIYAGQACCLVAGLALRRVKN